MPTIGVGDDFVWIGGLDEGLWLLVVVGDEAIDGGLEIDDAFEEAALEAPLAQSQGDDALVRSSTIACRRLRSVGLR
jgi:hypothetical protein